MTKQPSRGIAIIGMACHFPGADTPREFWQNLRNGTESITFFSDEELVRSGVDPSSLENRDYVKASPILKNAEAFDAAFFGYSPKEAAIMDPQHRLFLETCWETFEDAGYDPATHGDVVVGVFAGAGSAMTSYSFAHHDHPDMQGQTAGLQHINNDKDFLATRVSYKLNLTGPSMTVQTACSTALVAVHLACQSLLTGECDVALAGASTVRVPHVAGYMAARGSVHSTDGHCRAFDAAGAGTIFGSGVAAVLLKVVAAALEDGDHIYAVIKGSAVTNDGAGKVSYTAASAVGQARAVVEALEAAEVSGDSISYVECHATGTPAGDPVEIQALTRAFRLQTRRKGFCAVGSVKTNIGHPEQTAGLAGLIKAALALEHGQIPPTVHFTTPNPSIPFADSPFYVQSTLADWARGETPRRAAVNSLGIGGTNAFVVLEEAPDRAPLLGRDEDGERSGRPHLFCMSARTAPALRSQAERFLRYLEVTEDAALEDICHTANASRSAYAFRSAVTCATKEELTRHLQVVAHRDHHEIRPSPARPGRLAFLFSGQGTQHLGMSAELYRMMPRYRAVLDECDAALRPHLKTSLLEILFAPDDGSGRLNQTRFVQPALFAVEYALSELWRSWGVAPGAVMGHSVGELVAACVAGVLEFSDAIEFVAARGELMQDLPVSGAMEAFFADEETVRRALSSIDGDVDIAAINSPRNTVVSGERTAVARLRDRLAHEGVRSRRLDVSEAFHSALLDPVLPRLEKAAAKLASRAPNLTFISNTTGRPHQTAPLPAYWRDHARATVRFREGMLALRELGYGIFLEIGPGSTAVALGRECVPDEATVWLASINRQKGETATILDSLGRLYVEGYRVDWEALAGNERRRRVPLPTYPFERKRFWLGDTTHTPAPSAQRRPPIPAERAEMPSVDRDVSDGVAQCIYHVTWEEQRPPTEEIPATEPRAWLVFSDGGGVGAALVKSLEQRGDVCHVVLPDHAPASVSPRRWTLDSAKREAFDALLDTVRRSERCNFSGIVFLSSLDAPSMRDMTIDDLHLAETTSARSTLYLVQALAVARGYDNARLWIVTRGAQRVAGALESCEPAQAMLWGLGRTIALEFPNLWGGTIDLSIENGSVATEAESLVRNILHPAREQQLAVRGERRYVARIEQVTGDRADGSPTQIRSDSTYLITGGSGMLGLTTARWLVEDNGARFLALMSRGSPTVATREALARLEARGARVRVCTGDVSCDADVRRVLAGIREELPPLKGVIHCAGVLADGILPQMTWTMFTRATAAKVYGSWLLHRYLEDVELDFFLVQSSLLSLTGSAGQANYTAANAFLDALVDYRRSRGLPGTAINWGPWGQGGMAVAAGSHSEAVWRARGIRFILPAFARRALDHVFARSIDHSAVAICDWNRYVTAVGRSAPFYSRVTALARSDIQAADALHSGVMPMRHSTNAARKPRSVLLQALREQLTSELGLAGAIDTRQPLQQLGVDSLMSVNLANRLEATLGVSVPIATLVRGPSLEELADELLAEFAPGTGQGTSSSDPAPAEPVTRSPRAESRGHGWLVVPQPNDAALVRLFCFNFAGGGAAPFRPWAALLAPWIELAIVEPPGRGSRLDESPLVRIEQLLTQLIPQMRPYLDKPCAFFGHCLGALTLFEAARHVLREGFADLLQVFVSGARPPHRVAISGPFEESLLVRLLADPHYDPLRPVHEQPDDTFADVLRQFNIWATDDFLAQRELRALLLPAIRADFEIATTYKATPEPPWEVPITCFNGLDDRYVTREQAIEWNRHTSTEFRMHLRKGNHFLVVEDRDYIVSTINTELAARLQALARRS